MAIICLHAAIFGGAVLMVYGMNSVHRWYLSNIWQDRGHPATSHLPVLTVRKQNSLPDNRIAHCQTAPVDSPIDRLARGKRIGDHLSILPGRTRLPGTAWTSFGVYRPAIIGMLVGLSILCVGKSAARVLAGDGQEADWSGFQNQGQLVTGASLPVEWSPTSPVIAWQAELTGYGQSSPIVRQSSVFVTSTSGENKELFHVAAFDLRNGTKSWQVDFDNPTPQENTSYISRAAPTPVADSQALYVVNEGGLLASLDYDGEIVWQRDLVAEYGPIESRHGLASSLEQDSKNIYVWIERTEAPYLMAVDKDSGETVWKVEGLGATSWSSPRLIDVDSSRHLVCSGSGLLAGFDPESGERLWELTDIENNTACTPMPAGEARFLIGASDGRGEENAGKGAPSNGLVQIMAKDDGSFAAKFVWRAEKASSSFGSLLVAADRVWIVNRVGVLYQLDLKTGEQVDISRVGCGSIWATPFVAQNRVYLFGQKGTTSVLAIEDGRELASNSLWGLPEQSADDESPASSHVQYAAAAAGEYLIVRRGDRIYALKNP